MKPDISTLLKPDILILQRHEQPEPAEEDQYRVSC